MYEDVRLVVLFFEGEPGGGAIDCLYPLRQQGRFAKAGWGRYQCDVAAQPCIQAIEETDTGDQITAVAWSVEFGLHQDHGMVDSQCHAGECVFGEPGSSGLRRGHVCRLACERPCSSLQSLQGKRVRVSQVDTVELTLTPAVRFPVGTLG